MTTGHDRGGGHDRHGSYGKSPARPDPDYPGVGATERGGPPLGSRTLAHRARIGRGEADFRAAVEAVLSWHMHHGMGVRLVTDSPRARPGASVTVGLGVGRLRVWAPCRVVWTADGPSRAGWGYGTLAGHPVRGEEAFVVTRDPEGVVWLTVLAFSWPLAWWARAAGPLLPVLQRAYAWWCGVTLRRIVRRPGRAPGTGVPEPSTPGTGVSGTNPPGTVCRVGSGIGSVSRRRTGPSEL
ncbi:DUF1990 family protein [Streptomyces oceani]|uniref:DUF1990 family protein n=1 Tax=Streptomyces oceani TaxID=1075402 RepID=UPI0008734C19